MSNLDEIERLREIIEENEMAMALMDSDLLAAAETVKRWENNYNMLQKSYSDLLAELTKEREANRQLREELEFIRPDLRRFVKEMEQTLRKNDYKGGWKDCSFRYLYANLQEEKQELWVEYNQQEPRWEGILREAPDVANIAMMIADIARIMLAKEGNEPNG